eukprot:COSAG02_NODE_1302_length_13358_cov_12.308243_8_plen_88_part_00
MYRECVLVLDLASTVPGRRSTAYLRAPCGHARARGRGRRARPRAGAGAAAGTTPVRGVAAALPHTARTALSFVLWGRVRISAGDAVR